MSVRWSWKRAARRASVLGAVAMIAGAASAAFIWRSTKDLTPRLRALSFAPVYRDAEGSVHLVRTAEDGQVRLPVSRDAMGPWIASATIAAEDVRFGAHRGVDWRAVVRAAWVNVRSGRRAEGASTIAMQVVKMLEPRPRTLSVKISEALRALKLTARISDDAMLEAYLTLAPYGGNRVGAEAAARAYFGRALADLTLDEAALLAGLPQSPERFRPDRFQEAAIARRDSVLERMARAGFISAGERAEAQSRREIDLRRPSSAPPVPAILFAEARRSHGGTLTLEPAPQRLAEEILARQVRAMRADVHGAAVILDIERNAWVALATASGDSAEAASWLPLFSAPRSPGSALKPFIYAAAMDAGRLEADTLIPDRAADFAGWRPRNFAGDHAQWTTAADALRRSLNIPAIHLLRVIGLDVFAARMHAAGLPLDARVLGRAGLGLAVGTAEVRLIDLTAAYSVFARGGLFVAPRLFTDDLVAPPIRVFSTRTAHAIDDILSSRHRAPESYVHLAAEDRPWMTWKTGTSAGHRDAWAVGHNGRYVVGVWIGRPEGGTVADLTGAQAAEPVLAEMLGHRELRGCNNQNAVHALSAEPACSEPSVVARPIDWSRSIARRVIESPRPGAVYGALEGSAVIPLRASEPVRWLLDATPVAPATDVLRLSPGRYELLAIDRDGRTHRTDVTVVTP